jgi:hypothetical protein
MVKVMLPTSNVVRQSGLMNSLTHIHTHSVENTTETEDTPQRVCVLVELKK